MCALCHKGSFEPLSRVIFDVLDISTKGYFWSVSGFDTSFEEGSAKDPKNHQGEGFCR